MRISDWSSDVCSSDLLIAGLGLTGFALGLAVKDAVANLISGVLILLYRPFGYGSTIIVSGIAGAEGRVVSIDLRYTTLETETSQVLEIGRASCRARVCQYV